MKFSSYSTAKMAVALLIAVTGLILTVFSCKQDEKAANSAEMKFNLRDKSYPNAEGIIKYCAFDAEFKVFKDLANSLCSPTQIDGYEWAGIVFYHNSTPNLLLPSSDMPEGEDINGVSIFTIDQTGIIHHSFYGKKAGVFQNLPELNLKTNMIGTAKMNFVKSVLSKEVVTHNYFIAFNKTKDFKLGKTDDEFALKITIDNRVVDLLSPLEAASCPSPCFDTKGCDCNVYAGTEEKYCDPCGPCQFTNASTSSSIKTTYSSKFLTEYLDLEKYRKFRDDFLATKPIGRKFIRYYDALGGYLSSHSKYDTELLIETAKYLPNINKVVDVLTTEGSREIVITEKDRLGFIQILSKYKAISQNKDYQFAISDIEKEINNFSGKNRAELIAYLNSNNY